MNIQTEWKNLKHTAQKEWVRLTYKTQIPSSKDNYNSKWFVVAHAALGMLLVNICKLAGIQAWLILGEPNADTAFAGIFVFNGLVLFMGYLISERVIRLFYRKFFKAVLALLWILLYILSNALT